MKKTVILITPLLIILFSSMMCENDVKSPYYTFVTFENRTGLRLEVCTSLDYPDTLLSDEAHYTTNTVDCNASEEIKLPYSRGEIFAKTAIVQLFVFDHNVLIEAELDKSQVPIRDRHLELRRYELSREWLEEHNWTVTYP